VHYRCLYCIVLCYIVLMYVSNRSVETSSAGNVFRVPLASYRVCSDAYFLFLIMLNVVHQKSILFNYYICIII